MKKTFISSFDLIKENDFIDIIINHIIVYEKNAKIRLCCCEKLVNLKNNYNKENILKVLRNVSENDPSKYIICLLLD